MKNKRFEQLDKLVANGYVKIYSHFLELLTDPQKFYEAESNLGDNDMLRHDGELLLQFDCQKDTYFLAVYRAENNGKLFHYMVDYYEGGKEGDSVGESYSLDKAYAMFLKNVLSNLEKNDEFLVSNEK